MPKHPPIAIILSGLIASLAPAATLAQAPGQGPGGPGPWPGFATPPWGPAGAWSAPFSAQARPPAPWTQAGPPQGQAWPGAHRPASGLRLLREATTDAYLVRIELGGARPETVQTAVYGQWLGIRYRSDAQTFRDERSQDGRVYRHSYSVSRGAMTRRLPLPPDADPGRLTREVRDGALILSIPRLGPSGSNRGYLPPPR